MEIDWGGKPNYTSYGCPMAKRRGHETHNPNHMNESLLSEVDWGAHDSSVFLFLVNTDYMMQNQMNIYTMIIGRTTT